MTVQPTPQNEPTPDPKEALSARVALPEYQENLAWPELKPLDEKPPAPAFPWAEFKALLPDEALAAQQLAWARQLCPEIAIIAHLAIMSALAQRHIVLSFQGNIGLIGAYYLIVAPSSTGKSSLPKRYFKALESAEKAKKLSHKEAKSKLERDLVIERGKKEDTQDLNHIANLTKKLKELGRSPNLIFQGGTIEGLVATLTKSPKLLCYNPEAASWFGGGSFKSETATSAISILNDLWSDGVAKQILVDEERCREVYDARLTALWAIQPSAYNGITALSALKTGLQSRLLTFTIGANSECPHDENTGYPIKKENGQLVPIPPPEGGEEALALIMSKIEAKVHHVLAGQLIITYSKEAEKYLFRWCNQQIDSRKEKGIEPPEDSPIWRKEEHIGRLASALHDWQAEASSAGSEALKQPINMATVALACSILGWFIAQHVRDIYQPPASAVALLKRLEKGELKARGKTLLTFTVSDIVNIRIKHNRTKADAEQAIAHLVSKGYLRAETTNRTVKYHIHPEIRGENTPDS